MIDFLKIRNRNEWNKLSASFVTEFHEKWRWFAVRLSSFS